MANVVRGASPVRQRAPSPPPCACPQRSGGAGCAPPVEAPAEGGAGGGVLGAGAPGGAGQRFSRGSAGGPETALCVFAPCCSCGGAGRGERQPRGVGGGRGKAWGASGASRSVQPGRPFREAAKSGRPAGARPAVQAVFPRGAGGVSPRSARVCSARAARGLPPVRSSCAELRGELQRA